MVYVGPDKFGINLRGWFGEIIHYPQFIPKMKFVIEKHVLSFHLFDYVPTSWVHDEANFEFSYEKWLTHDEIEV